MSLKEGSEVLEAPTKTNLIPLCHSIELKEKKKMKNKNLLGNRKDFD